VASTTKLLRPNPWLVLPFVWVALFNAYHPTAHGTEKAEGKFGAPPSAEFQVDVFTPRHGMPGLSVTALAQAADGHIWIGLKGQVARFDGLNFEAVRTPTQMSPRSEVRSIVVQGQDIWIGTMSEGVMRLGKHASVWTYSDGLPAPNVAKVCRDNLGNLWAGTTSAPAVLEKLRFEPFAQFDRNQWHAQGVNDLLCTAEGVLVAPHDGPPWWIPQTAAATARKMPKEANADKMVMTADGTIWLGGIDGGLVGVAKSGELIPQPKGLPTARISTMMQDASARLWVGTWGAGLYQKQQGSDSFSRVLEHELPSGTIRALASDQDGTLWVGTDAGLAHIRPRLFTHIALPKAFEGSPPRSILVTRDGALWAASDGAGVASHPPLEPGSLSKSENWHVYTKQEGLPSLRVFSIAETKNGEIFVGTNLGAAKFNGLQFETLPQAHDLPLNEVRTMFPDPDGGLWMGIAGQGLIHRSVDGAQVFYGPKQGMRATYVEAFATDSTGQLWVGAGDGLFRFTGDHFLQHDPQVWSLGVSAITNAADGSLWVAGVDSIRRMRSVPPYETTPIEVPSASENFGFISDILVTNKVIWVLSRHGLFQAPAHGSEASGLQRFGIEDGLRDADFSYPASPRAAVLPDGRVLFNSGTEIVVTKLEARTPPKLFPPVITGLTINGKVTSTSVPLEVPAGRNRLDFSFAAVTFANASALEFLATATLADQLEAAPPGLLQKSRSATFQNLPSGRYVFSVSVVPPGFTKSPYPAATLSFTIALSWHERWWMRMLLGMAIVATFVIAGAMLRARQLASRFALLTAERNRIAIDLHDGIEQNMAGILLQLGVAEHRLPQEHPALAPVAAVRTIVGQVHSDLRHQVWQLRGRGGHADLKSALTAQMQRAKDAGLETSLGLPVSIKVSIPIEEILLRTVEEAVTNCLKHANARQITVEISQQNAQVALVISDNGVGFNIGDLNNTTITHLGIIGMRERIENAHGELRLETSPGKGTSISLTLPI
jgi:signal transduction histidine kinase/ligand-binding sensor domain-containing protein